MIAALKEHEFREACRLFGLRSRSPDQQDRLQELQAKIRRLQALPDPAGTPDSAKRHRQPPLVTTNA